MMPLLEPLCALIVTTYVVTRCARAPRPGRTLVRLGCLALASWVGEDSVIRAYGFYGYSDAWSVSLDRVPLLIVLIWPVVIDSAWQLARRLTTVRRVPLVGAAFVLADASLIEPIAVRAGLWSWTEPGLFAVPPIGVLGWAFFALGAIALLDADERGALPWRALPAALLAPAVGAHVLLVASWWLAFRWFNGTVPAAWGAVGAWALLAPLAVLAWRGGLRHRVPFADMLVRVPGAAFFFVLLGLHGRGDVALVAWALAFVPPYCALLSPSTTALPAFVPVRVAQIDDEAATSRE